MSNPEENQIEGLKNAVRDKKFEISALKDDVYALKWRNNYLRARIKYLEGRLSDKNSQGEQS